MTGRPSPDRMTGKEERTLRALVAGHAGEILLEWTDSRVKTEGQ